MTSDDTFARLDELTEKYNDVLDQIQEVRAKGGYRQELDDKAGRLQDQRRDEGLRLHRAGVTFVEIEAHLEATDRYRHGM